MIFASEKGHKEIVDLLLANGADVNIKTTDGRTALTMASKYGHKEVKKLLIRAGAK